MSDICKIGYVDICQETCLHDKLHMDDICHTYVNICPIPIGTQVYPTTITDLCVPKSAKK